MGTPRAPTGGDPAQIEIRYRNAGVTPSIREWAERRVTFALDQFRAHVHAVTVRLSDQNGPKGGVDQRCLMEARLAGAGTIVVEARADDLYVALSRTADRLSRRVRSVIERRRDARHTDAAAAFPLQPAPRWRRNRNLRGDHS